MEIRNRGPLILHPAPVKEMELALARVAVLAQGKAAAMAPAVAATPAVVTGTKAVVVRVVVAAALTTARLSGQARFLRKRGYFPSLSRPTLKKRARIRS